MHLAGERKQVFVDDLGGLAVPLVLLGLLDVLVRLPLRLEPLSTSFIRARERSLAGVIHQVILQGHRLLECRRAAWMGAGESWHIGVHSADVALQVGSLRKGSSTIFLFADERPLAQMHRVVVAH